LAVVSRADGEQPVIRASSIGPVHDSCADSQKAITYYRRAYREHRTTMGLAGPVPRVWYTICADVRRRAVEWRDRAATQREALAEWNSTIGTIVRRLDAGLQGTPMSGLGAILEQQGRRYGISPFFMAAAAGTESSFGAAACANNRRNVWGLAACDGRWHVPYFNTWTEAIRFYARFLASRWHGHSTPYSFTGYAACDACWGRKTSAHMGRFGVGNSTRYVTP
jgi:hypothetical protein